MINTLVWVCFLSLNFVFYYNSFLLELASVIGKFIKVGANELHVCVEINLHKLMVSQVLKLRLGVSHWYNIEYEGQYLLCRKYGHYGHHTNYQRLFVSSHSVSR
ncbi:hypothetical protein GmHk_08G021719 [Glycine max]|nr:hypothetical protein GmHk_08G021719 [Glycine max]